MLPLPFENECFPLKIIESGVTFQSKTLCTLNFVTYESLNFTFFNNFVTLQSRMYALGTLMHQILQRFEFNYLKNKNFCTFISKPVLQFIALYEFLRQHIAKYFLSQSWVVMCFFQSVLREHELHKLRSFPHS